MARIDLSKLFIAQAELDAQIHANHQVSYETTWSKRVLAVLVELGELANETRAFKFWSLKGPSPDEKILDELADVIHFLLSLGLAKGFTERVYSYPQSKRDLTYLFLKTYEAFIAFDTHPTAIRYRRAWAALLRLVSALNFSEKAVIEAYFKKRDVNFKRQEAHY